MRKIAGLVIVIAAFFTLAGAAHACPADRFIGKIRIWQEASAPKDGKAKLLVLYPGDQLVIERDNRNGDIWVIGIYDSNMESGDEIEECVMPIRKTKVSPADVVFNVNINEKMIFRCR